MNMQTVNELTHLSVLLDHQPQSFIMEKPMVKRRINFVLMMTVFLILALFLTYYGTDTLTSGRTAGAAEAPVSVITSQGSEYAKCWQHSGHILYDQAANMSRGIHSLPSGSSFRGDDAYDPAAGGLSR